MNNNKTVSVMVLLSIVIVLACVSCRDVLNVEPKTRLTANSFYKTSKDAQYAVNAAYDPLGFSGLYGNNFCKILCGSSGDVRINNTGGLYFSSWSIPSSSSFLDGAWQDLYEGVFRSNMVLQKVPKIDMDKSLKARILGEAHFLRAFYYFKLTTLFGDIPLIKEADPNDLTKAEKPKSPKNDIYNFMIKDLKKASSILPKRSEYASANIGRATKGAAQALLGKIYLYAKNYPMAETYLDSVINSHEYKLVDDYSKIWRVDNNVESIFEIQFSDIGGGFAPSEDHAGANESSYRHTNNLPKAIGEGWSNYLPTQRLVDAFEHYSGPTATNGRDPRLFYTVYSNGDPYGGSMTYKASWSVTGYFMKKGMTEGAGKNHPKVNVNTPVLRLGGIILLDAEAANDNDEPSKAIKLLNEIRDRTTVEMPDYPTKDYPVSSKQEIFKAIVHERQVELGLEMHRLNDLRRWGLAKTVLAPIGYQAPKDRYFPIPQQEVDNNPKLKQNPNW